MSFSKKPGLYVKTFGCQMNEYDSQRVIEAMAADYRHVEDPAEAELIFVNTCSVREKPEHKLYSLLGTLKSLKQRSPNLVVGVGGCVAQQEGYQIVRRSELVDFVVGTHNLSLVPSLVRSVKLQRGPQIAVDYRDEWEDLASDFDIDYNGVGDTQQAVRALIAIQRGCNKNCSFCVVPTTRGVEVSRPPEEILREVRMMVRRGAKEILLLGQTVNSYGRDLTPRTSFAALVKRVAEVQGVCRIRFTSPHPADIRKDFLALYGEVPQLVPHMHLPLQSGSDRILKLMNRNYRRQRYLDIVEELRGRCPDIAISSDIIVGFPTETEEEFEETLEVMREVRYHTSYSFKYSRRPNTAARTLFEADQEIPGETASWRLSQLQSLQDEISAEINSVLLGSVVEVLVEGRGKQISSHMRGRTPQNTLVSILDEGFAPGDLVKVRIEHASARGLRGRVGSSPQISDNGG